jgi:GH15 family glucan-1,4-alpha-glucosidase
MSAGSAEAATGMAPYIPIAEHGLIGDLHTVALVGTDGTIDCWWLPRVDSPSVFAALLDSRAMRIARQRGVPADEERWRAARDAIYERIIGRCWSDSRQAFVQHEGSEVLDASVLLMPRVKFVAGDDPRWLSTLDAIIEELVSDGLVYRYDPGASPDGLLGSEGTFSICSFWWVEALTRAGRLDEAQLAFEKMLTYANHVGLYSEEIGPLGEALDSFPQAFTHLALISCAFNLDRALG